jgi:hypothetical protein
MEGGLQMDTLLLTFLTAIFFLGMFVIVLPFAMDLYRRFNFRKVVTCPETRGLTEVKLNALWAALTGIFCKPALRVKSCTLWPKKKGCAEACVRENWPAN